MLKWHLDGSHVEHLHQPYDHLNQIPKLSHGGCWGMWSFRALVLWARSHKIASIAWLISNSPCLVPFSFMDTSLWAWPLYAYSNLLRASRLVKLIDWASKESLSNLILKPLKCRFELYCKRGLSATWGTYMVTWVGIILRWVTFGERESSYTRVPLIQPT